MVFCIHRRRRKKGKETLTSCSGSQWSSNHYHFIHELTNCFTLICLTHEKVYKVLVSNKMKNKIYHTVWVSAQFLSAIKWKTKYTTLSVSTVLVSNKMKSKIYHTVLSVGTVVVSSKMKTKYTTLSSVSTVLVSNTMKNKIYHPVWVSAQFLSAIKWKTKYTTLSEC